ncbi:MAG: glycosyltransferase [Treponema sp.]|nr:glycosyltransferase [Treponema sp.]
MKILLLNYIDAGGGAAIAAYRLTKALNENGIEATLGVVEKKTSDNFVVQIPAKKISFVHKVCSKLLKIFNKIQNILHIKKQEFKTTNKILHSTNLKSKIDVNWINDSDYDLVNLHWVNNDMISIKDIAKIKKPIVWTMHDSWPCCGAEHHPNILENDTRFKEGYTNENRPVSTSGRDICKIVYDQKKKYLTDKNITFIAPSNWEHDILKSSDLFSDNQCHVIPNILPENEFYVKDKTALRKALNIPLNKKVIGFGAAGQLDDPNSMKGSYYVIEALKKIKNPEKYFLMILGPADPKFTDYLSIPFFNSGFINNSQIFSCLYNVCDVVINPSLIENLPTMCLESVFCQIPVVAFDVGGTSDIVKHKSNGYLAKPYEVDDLLEGIYYCLKNKEKLSENCRQVKKDFSNKKVIEKHIEVYKSVITH